MFDMLFDEMEDKKKRENRPTISLQKQQIILKEQNYKCRGPGKYDNEEYECDMNANGKRFCDKKSNFVYKTADKYTFCIYNS